MLRNRLFTLLLVLSSLSVLFSQQITTDNTSTPQQLIQDMVGDNCATVSNISSPYNGNINNIVSYGSFNSNSSSFPLENGIILSTGNVSKAGNSLITDNLNDGDINWETDPDVLNILGIDQTLNATSIQFNFSTANNFLAFRYVFASDEYQQDYPCNFRDVFGILIRPAGSAAPFVNIALVPNSNTEISTNTIHPNINGFCDAVNEEYFQGYNIPSTNFNGQSVVLTSSTEVIPNEVYEIKFVIADHIDQRFDSAVFIEAQSFGGAIDLGPDQEICGNDFITLNAGIDNPSATYTWFLDDNLIGGETNSTLQVNEEGIYRVEIELPLTGGNCILSDSVQIEVIPFQPAAPIEDVFICDSIDPIGISSFDFSTLKDDEILSALPSNDYVISYHLTQNDAQNNTNPIIGTYENSEPTETIFVRIESLDGSCLQLGSFNIQVDFSPSTQDYDLEVCIDQIADPGISDINQLRSILADNNLDRDIRFFLTEEDATNLENQIFDFPDFNDQPPFVVARISLDSQPESCFSLAYLNFIYIGPPPLFTDRLILDACIDPDYEEFDGTTLLTYANVPVTFDIEAYFNTIENEIFPGSTVRTLALYGLGNPRSFTLRDSPSFTFRLGISFENGNCFSEIELEVHKNYLFNVIGEEKDINRCDDNSNDGIIAFNFNEMRSEIIDGLTPEYTPNLFIEYYDSEEDRTAGINEIEQTNDLIVNGSETLYIKAYYVINGIVGCSIDSQINLNVETALNLPDFTIEYCGNTDPITNTTNVILEPVATEIRNEILTSSNSVVAVDFFVTEEDALNEENPLVNNYNLSEGQILFTRVTNAFTGCFDIAEVSLNITAALEATNPEPIVICDTDQNLIETVNLEVALEEFPNENTDISFSFYESFNDAIDENRDFLAIPGPENYTTSSREIFIRADIESENCFSIFSFNVFIYADPQLNAISDIINCEVDPNLPSDFIFENKDAQIIGNQQGMEVLYFESESEAINRENPIDKTTPYQNTSNPQIIYVRLENEAGNSCFKVAPMQIEVRETPNYNAPSDIFECDINNSGLATINLNNTIEEIEMDSTTDLNVSFHLTPLNAELGSNPIPLNYTTTSNPQIIYARIENALSGCYAIETFSLNTLLLPEVNYGQSLVACGNNYSNTLEWDLTDIELSILDGRQYNIDFTYFNSEVDAQNNTNAIANPTAYTNTTSPETLYVKVRNASTDCFAVAPFELIINSPPTINDFETYNICENDENSVDLQDINQVLLENTFNILISYHTSIEDAENNSNPLNNIYSYTNPLETLVARIEYSTTGCYVVYPFEIRINPLPIANPPNDIIECDDDFDGLLLVDLSQQDALVLNGQNPDEYIVSYYVSEEEAIENVNPLNSDYLASNNEVIFVRVENAITGCFDITQFSIVINQKPLIAIDNQILCLNDLPLVVSGETNNPYDSYLWSTNETSSSIEITEVGTYSLTITNAFGCASTSTFTVTESNSATIDVLETIDFSDPNNITVTVSGIGDYLYQLNDLPFQSSGVFNNVPIGYNTITIIDQNGCAQITREVLVIDTPKHLTPNGDTDFDTWHITGVETLPGTIIYIFDRYGKLLKTLTHTSPGWDGTYNGNPMPSGDYWYVANVRQDNRFFQVKGHFALKR
ncbi:choice-of-anchor L domain-containing protein [Winogradskyella sp.]